MKTASPGLLEVMVVRVNAGGNAPSDPPSLVTSWAHPFQKSFLANERENIFGGEPLRSSRCLVHILKSSTCKHVKSGQERETETDRTLRAARFRRYINLQKNKLDCTSIDGVKHVAQIASSTEVDIPGLCTSFATSWGAGPNRHILVSQCLWVGPSFLVLGDDREETNQIIDKAFWFSVRSK